MSGGAVRGDTVARDAMARDAVSGDDAMTAIRGDAMADSNGGSRDAVSRDAGVTASNWCADNGCTLGLGDGVGDSDGGLDMALNVHIDGHFHLIGHWAVHMDGHLLDDALLNGIGHWLLNGHGVWLGHMHGVGTIDWDLDWHLHDLLNRVGLWHMDGHLNDLLHGILDNLLHGVGLWHGHLDGIGDGLLNGIRHMTLHLIGHLDGSHHGVSVHLCGQLRDNGSTNGTMASAQNGTATKTGGTIAGAAIAGAAIAGTAIAIAGIANTAFLLLLLSCRAGLSGGLSGLNFLGCLLASGGRQHAHSQQAKNELQCKV